MHHLKICLAVLAFAGAATTGHASEPDPRTVLRDAIGAVLQANGPAAKHLLKSLPPARLEPKLADIRACMLHRLDHRPQEAALVDRLVGKVLLSYETYWQQALRAPERRAQTERRFIRALAGVLKRPDLANSTPEALEPVIRARIEQAGYHLLLGRTGVLLELMLWSKQEERPYEVQLPEGTFVSHVFLLNDFLSRGWAAYFTCGRTGTGGWTKPEGLYAVGPSYGNLNDEHFTVNFLAHETQHFADMGRFPQLRDWEKEYRAKLVELSLADATRAEMLQAFSSNQGEDAEDPHSYANKRVLQRLRLQLGLATDADLSLVPVDEIQRAAKAELLADSAARQERMSPPSGAAK